MIRMADDPAVEWVDGDSVMTGEAVALALRPTGFALRAGGAVIDVIVSLIAFIVLIIGVSVVGGALRAEQTYFNITAIAGLVLCLVILPPARSRRSATASRSVASPWAPASCGTTAEPPDSGTRSSAHWSACSRSI